MKGVSENGGTIVQSSFIFPVDTKESRICLGIIEDACVTRIDSKEVLFGLEMACVEVARHYLPRYLYDSLAVTNGYQW